MRDYLLRSRRTPRVMLGGPVMPTVTEEWFSHKKLTPLNIVEININLEKGTNYEAKRFKAYLDTLLEEKNKNYILNLSKCGMLDSIFLGVIITFYKKIKEMNGNLKLVVDPNNTPVSLSKTTLGEIFDIYTQVEAALFSFKMNS